MPASLSFDPVLQIFQLQVESGERCEEGRIGERVALFEIQAAARHRVDGEVE